MITVLLKLPWREAQSWPGVSGKRAGLMLYVSILVELLRSRPALAVWLAALVQAFLWTLVPALFYGAPPGNLATAIAIGHEFPLGTYLGPPLAFWLAEVVYILSGHHLFGVYLLSQICVVVTYWAVFELGRATVGAQQAALAVLLMAGMSAYVDFTVAKGSDLTLFEVAFGENLAVHLHEDLFDDFRAHRRDGREHEGREQHS